MSRAASKSTEKRWRYKLEKQKDHKIVEISPEAAESNPMAKRFGTGRMLIPKPLDVDALIRQIPEGGLVTKTQIREKLARDHDADFTCPLTTGIFIRISAETAEEDRRFGVDEISPYWRIIESDGRLIDKFPGGTKSQAERLRNEGHVISQTGSRKTPKVVDFEQSLIEL